MPPLGELLGVTGRALGRLVEEQAAKRSAQAVPMGLRELAAKVGLIASAPKPHIPEGSLTKADVMDLLMDFYRPGLSSPVSQAEWEPSGKAFDVLQAHMPVDIDIPNPTNPKYQNTWSQPSAMGNMSSFLSTLSKMPPELFRGVDQARVDTRGALAANYKPWERSLNVRGLGTAENPPGSIEHQFPMLIAHEVTHSLVDTPDPEVYAKVLDFLEAAGWQFPVRTSRSAGGFEVVPVSRSEWATAQNNPGAFGWVSNRQFAPQNYETLQEMMYRPNWPVEGLPAYSPPTSWPQPGNFGSAGATYAERHPIEDIAESGAFRILSPDAYPVTPLNFPEIQARRVRDLRGNVRYAPITELLKAAGVPLAWLLSLVQQQQARQQGGVPPGAK